MKLIVGVDAGDTKTAAIVAREGEIISRSTGPGAKMRSGRGISSATTIAETVRRALGQSGASRAEVLIAGVAGAGREAERDELRQALRQEDVADRVIVTGDTEMALAAAFGDKPGIVVTAGTGSMGVARDPY